MEKLAWERLQEAMALMNAEDGAEAPEGEEIEPLYPKLRGLLLLRRSKVPEREYASVIRDLAGT